MPPQPWCEWCVLGRGTNDAHTRKIDKADHPTPLISMDFVFMKAEAEDGTAHSDMQTNLVVVDTATRMVKVIPMDSKGNAAYAATGIASFVRPLHVDKVRLRTDNEPSILAVANPGEGCSPWRDCVGADTEVQLGVQRLCGAGGADDGGPVANHQV